jgi:hypothetical protein
VSNHSDAIESGLTRGVRENEAEPSRTFSVPDLSRARKRQSGGREPLDPSEDEAIAQYLATPKSLREFKSFSELAKRFNLSRMTVYRRSKDPRILERAALLLQPYKRAGDNIARLNWPQIVASQVKAAVAGDTRAAQFCKEQAWPEDEEVGVPTETTFRVVFTPRPNPNAAGLPNPSSAASAATSPSRAPVGLGTTPSS